MGACLARRVPSLRLSRISASKIVRECVLWRVILRAISYGNSTQHKNAATGNRDTSVDAVLFAYL